MNSDQAAAAPRQHMRAVAAFGRPHADAAAHCAGRQRRRRATTVVLMVLAAMVLDTRTVRADDYGLPTEVVEEWGCHDTEIRLTCGSLDATLAILEATYTPNCSGQENDDDCIHANYKNSYHALPSVDHQISENEAGRQFLAALQRHRLAADRAAAEQQRRQQQESATGVSSGSDAFVSIKSKRNSLRDALERMVADYLQELQPTSSDSVRSRRWARQSDDDYADEADEATSAPEPAVGDDDDADEQDVNDLRRIEIGSRNITVLPTQRAHQAQRIGKTSECPEFRRRVTKLDQYELDRALMKDGESRELNIRGVLNHRCSGKNHCSFAFTTDYPYSILWHDGNVRIKYICMNNFRLNKYCNERLHIDNEPEPTLHPSPQMPIERKGEPIAEARVGSDQSFHNLKILKSDPGTDSAIVQTEPGQLDAKKRRKHAQSVYSQDFKFFKIIPSHGNANQTSKTNSVANASETNPIYWKVDPRLTDSTTVAESTTFSTTSVDVESKTQLSTSTQANPTSTPTPAPTTAKSTTINPIENVIHTTAATTTPSTSSPRVSTTTENTKANVKSSTVSTTTMSQLDTITETNAIYDVLNENKFPETNDNSLDRYVEEAQHPPTTEIVDQYYDSDEDDRSLEDYAVETYGRTVVRKNKVRIHTSYQVASPFVGLPLRQGFLATTGYPQYYVGESNCSWTLSVPRGHRVRLTVLDLNLRAEDNCRDILEIIDQNNVIYSGCKELGKPMQIVSDSHEIRISVRTTSRLAFPKRGVLIHYTAMGCLLLPVPANGRLVSAARDTAKYACQAPFVFADSAVSSRELHCTEHYTWDKSLPDCIEQHLLQPNAIIAAADNNRTFADTVRRNRTHTISQRPTADRTTNGTKMSDKNTDMLYDVAIPSMIIASLFIANAVIFLVIMRCRNKRKTDEEANTHEMSRL